MGVTAAVVGAGTQVHSAEQAYHEGKKADRQRKKDKKDSAIKKQQQSDLRVAMGTNTRQRQSQERQVMMGRSSIMDRPRNRNTLG